MTYRWLSDLDQALAAGGVSYIEVPFSPADPTGASSWRTRGRPNSTGDFDPEGVLCHHTASPAGCDAATDLRVILAGNGDAPGPISQLYIGRDAVCYLVAAGRANHGGKGRRAGIDTGGCADMNKLLLGIEVGNNGVGERWGDAQTDVYGAVVAALCDWYGWAVDGGVHLHGTTGPPSGGCNSKIDPAGPWQGQPELVGSTMWSLDLWRAFVNDRTPAAPMPAPPEEDDLLPCPTLIQADGSDGTVAGAVYVTDGRFVTIRWVANTYELADIQYWLRAAGMSDEITGVARIASYGTLSGPPATFGATAAEFSEEP